MAAINDIIRPGDVISSDLIARMIALINAHDLQLSEIGPGGPPSVNLLAGFDPPLQQNVGRTLRVFGTFDSPLGTNLVSIAGLPISPASFQPGSNNGQLVFTIPTSITVPASGTRSVTINLSNQQGEGELPYILLPAVAGPPDPVITNVVDVSTSLAILRSSNEARITGLNFISPAGTNRVRLIFNPGATQTAFPTDPNGSLPINVAASTINPAPQASTLVFTLPAIGASLISAPGLTAPATLEFTVPGANAQAFRIVTVLRMA
jgi:hypothetical protein